MSTWQKIGVLFLAVVWTLVAAVVVLFGLWGPSTRAVTDPRNATWPVADGW
ncbi:hypothetical protein QNA24_33965 [Rhodococcus qingshengii]|uniref:hypothetical protein n=1 Tax=Rhodococcus qingshengii TaxID=334542 RepID=UPI0024BB1081|nr:hypothetical protein [Rhodococcus qingshengii]MDJ0491393.1 hypothetical protein [Rhodococcus qingshengii]